MRAIKVLFAFIFLVFIFKLNAFAANPTLVPVQTSTSTPIIGDGFTVNASISGALSSSNYFIKCRIGPNSSSLSEGQTYNSQTSKWLDDTGSSGSWIDMPQITTGAGGTWQGNLTCRIKSTANEEAKVLYLRACLNSNNSCDTSFQSSSFLTLNPIFPTSTPSPTPTPLPTVTNSPTPSPSPTNTPTPTKKPSATPTKSPSKTPTGVLNLSTPSSSVLGQNTKESEEANIEVKGTSIFSGEKIIPLILISLGILFLVICAGIISYPYIKKFKEERFGNG